MPTVAWWAWIAVGLSFIVLAWAALVVGLLLTGRREDARALATFIPDCIVLVSRLMADKRVPRRRKLLLAALIGYLALPFDLVPDFIPFLGEVDDVFLLMTALQRLISNAGRRVLLDHWTGARSELSDLNVERVLGAAAFFLPLRLRRRLRRVAKA